MIKDIEKRRLAVAKHNKAMHGRAVNKLGGRCANPACQWLNADGSRGCTDSRCLQIDHVYGDGAEDRKKFKHIISFYRFIVKNDCAGRYQVLCANCNWIKRHINHEHRHFGHTQTEIVVGLGPGFGQQI